MNRSIKILVSLALLYSSGFLVRTLHVLYGTEAMLVSIFVVLLASFCFYSILRQPRELQAIQENQEIEIDLEQRVAYLETLVTPVARRDKYSMKLLSLALIYDSRDQLLLCKLGQGEFSGQWQFLGGYVDPNNETKLANPRLKAEAEIKEQLQIEPENLKYLGSPTEGEPYKLNYSNRGINLTHIYEYRASSSIISSVLDRNGRFHMIKFKEIESVDLKESIALFVYDILEKYKGVVYTPEFRDTLEQNKTNRILEIELIEKTTSEIVKTTKYKQKWM